MTDAHIPPPPPGQPMEPFRPVEPEPFNPADYDAPVAPVVRSGGATPSGARVMNIALAAAVLVAAIGVSFAVGRATTPVTTPAASAAPLGPGGGAGASFDPNGNGQPGGVPGGDDDDDDNGGVPGGVGNGGVGRGFGRGGLSIAGTVTSVTATTVVITLAGGQTVTLPVDGNTTFHAQTSATQADVTAGKKVLLSITGGSGEDDDQNAAGPTVGDITLVP